MNTLPTNTSTKPFLRWAGGKNWLLKYLKEIIVDFEFNNYHEPFLGGGSVFFFLPKGKKTYLSDWNIDLINAFVQVRDNVNDIIKLMETYQNTSEFYYEMRAHNSDSDITRASQFIYLNQTSFNGIYRVNLKGQYNVPYGNRKKHFLDQDALLNASKKLKGVHLRSQHFYDSLKNIKQGDLVFLDPPYTITHNNNGFFKYNEKKGLFTENDQYQLAEFISQVKNIGAYYILTNAAHYRIKEIFNLDTPIELTRACIIGGKDANRGNYNEYLFTNI